jgi:hypothetical protein
MTFTDHVAAIRNIISKGAASKDLRISDRLIGHFLNVSRASLIDKFPSDINWQTICMELTATTMSSVCPDCELPEGCSTVLKSVDSLPALIGKDAMKALTIRLIDGTILGKKNLTNNKYGKHSLVIKSNQKQGWFIYNQHLYVLSDHNIPLVYVDGLFADPSQINEYTPCANGAINPSTCSESSMVYPVDVKAVSTIYDFTLRMLSQAYRFGEDSATDARDLAIQVLRDSKK